MNNTLVNIISDQTLPNYLFIKELYSPGDSIVFLETSSRCDQKRWILNALKASGINISSDKWESILLDEENWDGMYKQLSDIIKSDQHYLVNLTGGTKYMSLAVQSAFEKHCDIADFYYIPFPKNQFLRPYSKDMVTLIRSKVGIKEYMAAHNIEYTQKEITHTEEFTFGFFNCFINKMDENDKDVLDGLREFRNKGISDILEFSQFGKYTNKGKKNEKFYKPIPHLPMTLEKFGFVPKEDNCLSRYDIEYLTGGWYEEYMYHFINKEIKPDDIAVGVLIKQSDNTNNNDLDVVFTKGNKLFVIECKTSIHRTLEKGEEGMFKEIAYKAATIKSTLFRLPGFSIICSLNNENDNFRRVAKKMGINYYDKSILFDESRKKEFIDSMLKHSNCNI